MTEMPGITFRMTKRVHGHTAGAKTAWLVFLMITNSYVLH
jgi:hypothetical protein